MNSKKIKRLAKNQPDHQSLAEVFRSIPIPHHADKTPRVRFFRKLIAFLGPGYLVAVGYMDPGNWATALGGGSQFGYTLLFIALLSNAMAIILQSLTIRLGVAGEKDLARACRDYFPAWVNMPLWILAELAIIATDLAEVIGTAIALNLLFGIPLTLGVIITALDVFLILWLQNKGFRWIEAIIIGLLLVISVCFALQLMLANPDWNGVINGFFPSIEIFTNQEMLYLAIGIIGATVMPHNLYLHSAIVQTRAYDRNKRSKSEAIKFATFDSTLALMLALLINGSIIILAAAIFYQGPNADNITVGIEEAHQLLQPMLGSNFAPILFAVSLLACGISSTITATMAGQVVMEGFLGWRIAPWIRRLITRLIAIVPAVVVTILFGVKGTGQLLILSQVMLSLQLPFAIIPLVMFTSHKQKMNGLASPRWLTVLASVIGLLVIILNVKLLWDFSQLTF